MVQELTKTSDAGLPHLGLQQLAEIYGEASIEQSRSESSELMLLDGAVKQQDTLVQHNTQKALEMVSVMKVLKVLNIVTTVLSVLSLGIFTVASGITMASGTAALAAAKQVAQSVVQMSLNAVLTGVGVTDGAFEIQKGDIQGDLTLTQGQMSSVAARQKDAGQTSATIMDSLTAEGQAFSDSIQNIGAAETAVPNKMRKAS